MHVRPSQFRLIDAVCVGWWRAVNFELRVRRRVWEPLEHIQTTLDERNAIRCLQLARKFASYNL